MCLGAWVCVVCTCGVHVSGRCGLGHVLCQFIASLLETFLLSVSVHASMFFECHVVLNERAFSGPVKRSVLGK